MTTRTFTIACALVALGRCGVAAAQPPAPPAPVAPRANPAPPAPSPVPFPNGFGPDFDFPFETNFDFNVDMERFRIQMDEFKVEMENWQPNLQEIGRFAQAPRPVPAPPTMPPMPPNRTVAVARGNSPAESLYNSAHELIDSGRYERAIDQLDRLIQQYDGKADPIANRVDAALYWKAYAQLKESALKEAQATLNTLQQKFADSRWLKDAKALGVEVQQASGQRVSPEAQNDEELKLLALRGLMQSDPDRAVPMIEQLMAGNSSVRVKENALFVLSQSRDPRARNIITGVARSGSNPDLQLRAVRYLGAMRTPEGRQVLNDVYRSSSDASVKRAILQSYMNSDAVDQLADLAKNEKDPQLRRLAIRYLGQMQRRGGSGDMLKSLYASESDADIKREIVNSLANADNATALIDLARAEKNPEAKRNIVSKLSNMKSKEATDYLVELLK